MDESVERTADRDVDTQARREAFAGLFALNDRWLRIYLSAVLGNVADAEEVFQEVCVVLWRDYEKFDGHQSDDPGLAFRKWATVVAKHRVMQFRAKEGRRARQLSEQAMQCLAQDAAEQAPLFESRRRALHKCLERLSMSDRDLVAACYSDLDDSFRAAAEQLGRPANTVYKGLQRVRRALRECIDRRLAAEI